MAQYMFSTAQCVFIYDSYMLTQLARHPGEMKQNIWQKVMDSFLKRCQKYMDNDDGGQFYHLLS